MLPMESVSRRCMVLSYVIAFITVQLVFLPLRSMAHGKSRHFISITHFILNQQLILSLGTLFLWSKLASIIHSFVDDSSLRNARTRWKMICWIDVLKAVLCMFLALTHISFAFFFVWVGEEPNLLALLSLVSMAIYMHLIVFIIILTCTMALCRLLIRVHLLPSALRWLVDRELGLRVLVSLTAVSLVLVGVWVAQSSPVVRQVSVPIRHLPEAQNGFRIALITDVHIGPTVGRTRVQNIVSIANALAPDAIAISGDLTDGFTEQLKLAANPLRQLQARHGVFFVTGNHEYLYGNVDEWLDYLRSIGIRPLHNDHVNVHLANSTLCFAGVDDLYARKAQIPGHGMDYQKALGGCESNATVVMLAHQPNAAKIMLDDPHAAATINLILSGHTHAGQMYVLVPIVYMVNAFVRGLYYEAASNTHVYVSAGVNFFGPPVKMLGTCEISLLELVTKHSTS